MQKVFQNKHFWMMAVFVSAVFIATPFFFAEAGRDKLYVNKNASGTQDGSSSHPYKTIWQALNKANSSTDIFVAKGEYKENITIGKGVRVYGAGADKTTIKADDDDEAVVTMKHKARIESVTIRGGKAGVVVKEDSRADIVKTTIKDNDREGVVVLKGDTDSDHKVSIIDSLIKENGRSGVYAQKRKVVVMDSTVQDNKWNGVALDKDVTGWLEDNTIKENGKSGVFVTLDKSSVGIKKNSIYRNGGDGIQVVSYGATGWVNVDKSKSYDNKGFGVAKISFNGASVSVWKGLSVSANTQYWGNGSGSVSGVVRAK